jgi:GNAT superfamily N-acetyltransferase
MWVPRLAGPGDAARVAVLLDDFNIEFDTPTPGEQILEERLRTHLAGGQMFAAVVDDFAVALVSLRPNVWYSGPVGLLDELYVAPDFRNRGAGTVLLHFVESEVRRRGAAALEINVDGEDTDARRFYERHGYVNTEPGQSEPMLYYFREFGSD